MREKLAALAEVLGRVEITGQGEDWLVQNIGWVRSRGSRFFFIGNGGSAAIASHMAIDWLNRARVSALSLNDGAALTCIGNDYGYEEVFQRQLLMHARPGDTLIVVSSSGKSPNILRPLQAAHRLMTIVTLSGFDPDNPLRKRGDVNFYVPSSDYGIVETAHLGILHALLDKVAT